MPTTEAVSFVDAFMRLHMSGALYPMGHPRLIEMAEEGTNAARRHLESAEEFVIEVTDDGLLAGGSAPSDKSGRAERLTRELESLGIRSLTLRKGVTENDIVSLSNAIRDSIRASINGGDHMDPFRDLPDSVEVRGQEYELPGERSALSHSKKIMMVEHALSPLKDYELSSADRGRVEKLVGFLAEDAASRMVGAAKGSKSKSGSSSKDKSKDEEGVSPDDVLPILMESIRINLEKQMEATGAPNLELVFQGVEEVLKPSLGEEATSEVVKGLFSRAESFLLSAMPARRKEIFVKKKTRNRKIPEERYAKLREALEDVADQKGKALDWEYALSVETISVLLQLLILHPSAKGAVRLGNHLEASLADSHHYEILQVLEKALAELCRELDQEALDDVLPPLAKVMREKGLHAEFSRALVSAIDDGAEVPVAICQELTLELLRGGSSMDIDPQDGMAESIIKLLSRVDQATLRTILTESNRLREFVKYQEYSLNSLSPPRAELSAVYEAMLEVSIGPDFPTHLLQALHLHPPSGVAGAVLLTIDRADPWVGRLLQSYLRYQYAPHEAQAFPKECSKLLIQKLTMLPIERRHETWVLRCIDGLGQLRCSQSQKILEEIVNSRKGLVFKTWPSNSRERAQRALQERARIKRKRRR